MNINKINTDIRLITSNVIPTAINLQVGLSVLITWYTEKDKPTQNGPTVIYSHSLLLCKL